MSFIALRPLVAKRSTTVAFLGARRTFADKQTKEEAGGVLEKVGQAFKSDGAVGKQFQGDGNIGQVGEAVGGPFSSKGAIGKEFTDSGSVGGNVEKAATDVKQTGQETKSS
ncbi:hypothetical protein CI109_101941 [Kwoniella shandongensis]|uniref:Uncharacterized protein n=1 Tax=Kwoniella shandongensis TaxID=1734106 RepID=A0A5M6BXV8_9TREE|nr:uncharacterized protein CI109_005399 [Kwoniella shandongensis]KAA5526275.1 hypothetical protein CI109_005399 [Kwoniella shandongensis]